MLHRERKKLQNALKGVNETTDMRGKLRKVQKKEGNRAGGWQGVGLGEGDEGGDEKWRIDVEGSYVVKKGRNGRAYRVQVKGIEDEGVGWITTIKVRGRIRTGRHTTRTRSSVPLEARFARSSTNLSALVASLISPQLQPKAMYDGVGFGNTEVGGDARVIKVWTQERTTGVPIKFHQGDREGTGRRISSYRLEDAEVNCREAVVRVTVERAQRPEGVNDAGDRFTTQKRGRGFIVKEFSKAENVGAGFVGMCGEILGFENEGGRFANGWGGVVGGGGRDKEVEGGC